MAELPEIVQLLLASTLGVAQEHFEPGQEVFHEGDVIGPAEGAAIGHYIIRTLDGVKLEAGGLQCIAEDGALIGVFVD